MIQGLSLARRLQLWDTELFLGEKISKITYRYNFCFLSKKFLSLIPV